MVRSVTAAAAASGSRLNVTGSMSANTGRARSYTATLALATNDSGVVITSSPSLTPTARSARCSPAVPLETAMAWAAPIRCAKARSNSPRAGPSDSRPERSTLSTRSSSASPSTGRASGIGLADLREALGHERRADLAASPAGRPDTRIPYSSESTSASQEASITFSETPIEPHT